MGFVARFTASVTQYAFFVARAASALLLFHLIRPAGRQPPSPTPCRPAQKPKLRQQLSRSPRRFPPAPRTRDTGPRAAWPIVQTSRVVSPLLSGTILSLPPAAHRPLAQHPHSPSLPLLPPRTVARPATEGRPGDGNGARPDRSERRFRIFIATSFIRVLRRPLESALGP